MYNVRCKMCYFMWYILLATAFIFVLDATTGLQHGILLQILLSFTLIFHLWSITISGNRGSELEKFMLFRYFSNKKYVCRYKIEKRKANSLLAYFACNNPIS